VPDVPVTVSDSANGTALVVVFIVRIEVPDVVIEAGLKPPLVTPAGKPASLPTDRVTVPANPLRGATFTANVVGRPGTTTWADGLAVITKSGVADVTVTVRTGGLGSEFPLESITVSETLYVPGALKRTAPGFWAVEVAGEPPGKTQEYLLA